MKMPDDGDLREGTFYIDQSAATSKLSMSPAVMNERYDGPITEPSLPPGPQSFMELLPLGLSSPSGSSQVVSETSKNSTGFKIGTTVTLSPFTVPADRTVRRSLKGIHLFVYLTTVPFSMQKLMGLDDNHQCHAGDWTLLARRSNS